MAFVDIGLSDSYWQALEIKQQDIEYLYSFLLEKETPLPSSDLASALIAERIRIEKKHLKEKAAEKWRYLFARENLCCRRQNPIPCNGLDQR